MNEINNSSLTAIIPTRNRPDDLVKAVHSLVIQERLPDELIIVDQSSEDTSRLLVTKILNNFQHINIIYIHDRNINGLIEAKEVGVKHTTGDIVCFLEDDIFLEPEYFSEILKGFSLDKEMIGCCGIITNPLRQSSLHQLIFNLFHVGIYADPRASLWGKYNGTGHSLIPSMMISGGMSAWRREVFSKVAFDTTTGFHMFEDIDFSTRVVDLFGKRLYINPNARLEHHWSPVNRDAIGVGQRRKLQECIKFYRKRKNNPFAELSLSWLLIGLLLDSCAKTISTRSWMPLKGYFQGINEGFK
jgi:GT2 family glycosyltransferase